MPAVMILTALEMLVIGLAAWQLVRIRRSIWADREAEMRRRSIPHEPPQSR